MAENTNRTALPTDGNHQTIMGGVSSADGFTPLPVEIDPATGKVQVDAGDLGGGGTQYTEGVDISTDPAGNLLIFRDDNNFARPVDANFPLPITGSVNAQQSGTWLMTVQPDTYQASATDVTASGDTPVVSPSTGEAVRLAYICLSADGANSADVTVTVKIGATVIYIVSLKPGAIWARNIGAGRRYVSGATDDDLIIELSATQTVHVSTEYEII